MVYSKIETNHQLLALQLYDRLRYHPEITAFGDKLHRASHDTRELVLARRAVIRVAEADQVVVEDFERIYERVRKVLEPYGIELHPDGECLFLKLPNGQSNEPKGQFWLVPS